MNTNILKSLSAKSVSRKRWLWGISISAVVALLVAALACYLFPQQILTVDSGPVKADAMVVLGGGEGERPECAAELFKQGEAPKILVSGYGDCVSIEKLLEKDGVTNAAIILECKSRTTRENAQFSIPLLRSLGAHRVIIVTSWYHSRRALMCFEHYAPDIQFYSRPSYAGYLRGNEKAEIGKAENRKQPGEVSSQTSRASAGEVACWNKEQIPQAKQTSRAKSGQQTGEDGRGEHLIRPPATFSPSDAEKEIEAERVRAAQRAELKAQEGHVKSEYLKLLGYWVRYGVWPL